MKNSFGSLLSWLVLGSFVALLLLAPAISRADTITETFTFATLSGYSSETGTPFSQFNSALGTLNSITLNATATATFSGGGANDDNLASYTLTLVAGEPRVMNAETFGNRSVSTAINLNFSDDLLAPFIGSGSIVPSITVRNHNLTSASISSTFGTESVTYNYTPAATAAEPGSFLLLALVLLSGLWFERKRLFART